MPSSQTDICNQAIALIKAKAIQSIEENSLEARECRRFYPQVVAEMLEGPHDWSFANRRVALAAVTNGREHEWLFAYAVPADMASPIRLIPDLSSLGFPALLPGQSYGDVWLLGGLYERPYVIENGIVYSDEETAFLEYAINDVDEVVLPALVVRALTHDLASRIAVPVKGDRKLRRELLEETDLFWQRAIADDKNRHPDRNGSYISEAQLARSGWALPPG